MGSFIFRVPSIDNREVFIYNAIDVDLTDGPFGNSIYVSWTDNNNADSGTPSNNHARIQVAYSRDGGATWTVTTPHPTGDISTVDRFHQWIKVGEDGTVHVIYYDTTGDASRLSVNIFHSFSTDGAQTWSTPTALTTVSSPRLGDGFQYGDYNGMDLVMTDLLSIYTDTRDESGGASPSADVYVAGATVPGSGVNDIFVDGFETGDTSRWSGVIP